MTAPHPTPASRVLAYLGRRAKMLSIDKEVINGIDGTDFELTVSDLQALAASAPVAPTPLLTLTQQSHLLRNPEAIKMLMDIEDCGYSEAESMVEPGELEAWPTKRWTALKELGRSIVAEDPELWPNSVRCTFGFPVAEAAPVAPTPPGYALVPLKVPASLYPRLTGYEKPAPGDHHSDHDRQEIESRSAKAWGEIVQAASTQPSTHARNDALADEIVELLDSCECLENGQKENALAIVKRMCSAQFEHSEAQ